jgi:hypothetical protein
VSLAEKMTKPPARERVIADCCALVDSEVKNKGGLTGIAVKTGYGIVKAVSPKFVPEVVDAMLDQWVAKLEPLYVDWQKAGNGKSFGDYLTSRSADAADRLLQVTDERAARAKNPTVKKMYEKMRSSAKKHVEEALPGLGKLVEKAAA